MTGETFLSLCSLAALGVLSLSFLLVVYRIVKGPTLPDRVLGLDMLVATAIGFIAVLGVRTGYSFHLDIAIALGLVGFLATVAFARFILGHRRSEQESDATAKPARREAGR